MARRGIKEPEGVNCERRNRSAEVVASYPYLSLSYTLALALYIARSFPLRRIADIVSDDVYRQELLAAIHSKSAAS